MTALSRVDSDQRIRIAVLRISPKRADSSSWTDIVNRRSRLTGCDLDKENEIRMIEQIFVTRST